MTSIQISYSLFVAFSVATLVVQPLYAYVDTNDLFRATTGREILMFMLIYHGATMTTLFVIDRIIMAVTGSGEFLQWWRRAIIAFAFVIVAWGIDRQVDFPVVDGLNVLPILAMIGLAIVALVAVTALMAKSHQPTRTTTMYLAIISVGLTVLFIVQANPIGKPWGERATVSLDGDRDRTLRPVFVIIFDGMDSNVVIGRGFPAFGALAADSLRFQDASSNYFDTAVSIQSMMSGSHFTSDGFWGSPRLFTEMQKAG